MLHSIIDLHDPYADLIQDDPVRPDINAYNRIGFNREVLVSLDSDNNPLAVVCVSYQKEIPEDVAGLFYTGADPSVAIFYTIWSYNKGAGRDMIFSARKYISSKYPSIDRYVTLSPTTEMAKKFHLSNGATVLRVNDSSVNYEYV